MLMSLTSPEIVVILEHIFVITYMSSDPGVVFELLRITAEKGFGSDDQEKPWPLNHIKCHCCWTIVTTFWGRLLIASRRC